MATVTICSDLGAQKIKSVMVYIVSPSTCHEAMGPDARIFVFCMLSFKPAFSLSSFNFIKRLLQHHNSKGSVFQHSAFFMVQLSHPCITNGKAMAFTILKFVGKVMPLLFNMLSRFVTVFLPRCKHLLISWL